MTQQSHIAELFADIKEHVLYLQEIGVENLNVDLPEFAKVESSDLKIVSARPAPIADVVRKVAEPPPVVPEIPKMPTPVSRSRPGSRINALPSLRERPNPVVLKNATSTEPPASVIGGGANENQVTKHAASPLLGDSDPTLPDSSETIEEIRHDIGNCTRCPLHEGRTKIVHTTGNFEAELMFVGEAPGADEDAKGEPFVGRAGKLLTQIIEAIGYKREDVVIGNINRCRPPGNRQPTLPEAHTCRPFLLREIAVIKPKVIVVLGNTAMHNLLDTKVGISKMRGQFHDYFNVKVMPTFHPAYLLRDPSKKREVWEDMKMVREYLAQQK
ncbi:MAG: uracil-DNA glycosylase [Acidobacteriota bacterium]